MFDIGIKFDESESLHSNICLRNRRRVVDTIPHHAGRSKFRLAFNNNIHFFSWQLLRYNIRNTNLKQSDSSRKIWLDESNFVFW